MFLGGDDEIRTRDPLLARQVLSQLSYAPMVFFYLIGCSSITHTSALLNALRSTLSLSPPSEVRIELRSAPMVRLDVRGSKLD